MSAATVAAALAIPRVRSDRPLGGRDWDQGLDMLSCHRPEELSPMVTGNGFQRTATGGTAAGGRHADRRVGDDHEAVRED
jgi:hypothetical protein